MTTPSSTPATTEKQEEQLPSAGTEGATEEPVVITLDGRNLAAEVNRLKQENPDFLKLFNNEVGNAAAKQANRKYEPELKTLRQQLDDEKLQRRRLEILNMPEKDINEKFEKDPEFATEYAKVVHYKPQAVVDDPTPLIQTALEEIYEYAQDNKVSPEFITQINTKAQQGGYEADHWSQGIQKMHRDVTNEIIRMRSTAAPPYINPSITKPGADVAPAGRGSTTGFDFKTIAEFKAKPRSVQENILDQPGALDYVQNLMKKA